MSKKVLHIWGVSTGNFGDIVIDKATKSWFSRNIDNDVVFDSDTCRKPFTSKIVENINQNYDYLLVGAGGLILPDTKPNKNSCWQWNITKENIKVIKIPIYVISIGYNLFYNQTICHTSSINSNIDTSRQAIFNDNISTLIEKSQLFSMRHNGDIHLLNGHIPKSLRHKIKFQLCPTIEYTKSVIAQNNMAKTQNDIIWAFEIKEDRPNRRYYNTKEENFYNDIYKFIKYCTKNIPKIKFIILNTFRNNKRFNSFLNSKNIILPTIKQHNLQNEQLIQNLLDIDRLYCMGGHSQMIGYATGCDVRSIITHNKLKFFLEDNNDYKYLKYINPNTENTLNKLIETI